MLELELIKVRQLFTLIKNVRKSDKRWEPAKFQVCHAHVRVIAHVHR